MRSTLEELWQSWLLQGTEELYVKGLKEFSVTQGGEKKSWGTPPETTMFLFHAMLLQSLSSLQRHAVVDSKSK